MTIDRELCGLIDDLLGADLRRPAAYRRLTDDHLPWIERRRGWSRDGTRCPGPESVASSGEADKR